LPNIRGSLSNTYFESSPSYHTFTVELTGFIQFYIEQYGI
ncbi:DUF1896 family protein, partial [Phocaeicola vulgatus]